MVDNLTVLSSKWNYLNCPSAQGRVPHVRLRESATVVTRVAPTLVLPLAPVRRRPEADTTVVEDSTTRALGVMDTALDHTVAEDPRHETLTGQSRVRVHGHRSEGQIDWVQGGDHRAMREAGLGTEIPGGRGQGVTQFVLVGRAQDRLRVPGHALGLGHTRRTPDILAVVAGQCQAAEVGEAIAEMIFGIAGPGPLLLVTRMISLL